MPSSTITSFSGDTSAKRLGTGMGPHGNAIAPSPRWAPTSGALTAAAAPRFPYAAQVSIERCANTTVTTLHTLSGIEMKKPPPCGKPTGPHCKRRKVLPNEVTVSAPTWTPHCWRHVKLATTLELKRCRSHPPTFAVLQKNPTTTIGRRIRLLTEATTKNASRPTNANRGGFNSSQCPPKTVQLSA